MTENALKTPTVGKTVNRLRKQKQLTLDQLARQCGMSKSMLSQIERNETNPTLAIVWRLAEALGQSIDDLVRGEESPGSLQVIPENSIPVLHDPDGNYTLKILGPADLVNQIEWYELTLNPGASLISDSHERRTMEHLTILEGEVEIEAGEEKVVAKTGETARYGADCPHNIHNRQDSPARLLMMMILGGS